MRASAAIRPVEPSCSSARWQASTTAFSSPSSGTRVIVSEPGASRTDVAGARPGAIAGSSREA